MAQRHRAAPALCPARRLFWEGWVCGQVCGQQSCRALRGAEQGLARAGSAPFHLHPANTSNCRDDPKLCWHFSGFEIPEISGVKVSWAVGVQPKGCPAPDLTAAVGVSWSLGKDGCMHLGFFQGTACGLSPAHTRNTSEKPCPAAEWVPSSEGCSRMSHGWDCG